MRKTVTFVWESSRLFNTKGGGGKYVDSVTATTSRKSIRGSGRKETQHRDEEQKHVCSEGSATTEISYVLRRNRTESLGCSMSN